MPWGTARPPPWLSLSPTVSFSVLTPDPLTSLVRLWVFAAPAPVPPQPQLFPPSSRLVPFRPSGLSLNALFRGERRWGKHILACLSHVVSICHSPWLGLSADHRSVSRVRPGTVLPPSPTTVPGTVQSAASECSVHICGVSACFLEIGLSNVVALFLSPR